MKPPYFKNLVLFYLLLSINILFTPYSFAQRTFFQADTLPNKKRIWLASGTQAYVEIGSFAALYPVWYAQNASSDFHFFNDFGNWGNVDKYGHSYSAYQLSKLSSDSIIGRDYPQKNQLL